MTYQNDPTRDPLDRGPDPAGRRLRDPHGWGTGSIILASLAALAIVFGLFYAMNNRGETSLANRTDRPAATTPATTTGSGAANRIPDATGTKPAIPTQVPAPASPPATNR